MRSALLAKHGLKDDLSTVVLIDERGAHVRSTATLRVVLFCGAPYAALYYMFVCVPPPLRDVGYKLVAATRYRLFGKDDGGSCWRMTKDMKRRFLAH